MVLANVEIATDFKPAGLLITKYASYEIWMAIG
jgi:hypothetical protein